ncbi:hypothetical protein [Paraliobacillus sediminis]|uniref:hypothetical protein n=1 Tax=Paraliobacillus sediminis TaxID=1885916 RepID=UPI000E3C0A2A|nr:hypothetical protein [Paraliobacillus sediminis]
MFRNLSALFLLLFFLTACNSETFTFFGETEIWSAELKVNQPDDEYEEQKFELRYKGNDIDSVGEIKYMIETNAGSFGSSGVTLQDNGVLKGGSNNSPLGGTKVTEESKVEVTVEWNGNAETIMLSNN